MVIYFAVNVTDGHVLLWSEPRYSEYPSSANTHVLTFPDVPLHLHMRTGGEAVTATLPGMVHHRNEAEAEGS